MAEAIEVLRKAAARNSAKQTGQHIEQPTSTAAQQNAKGRQSDIFALPVDMSAWQPLQDFTPGSATLGSFFYMPGYSTPGGPDIVR